MCLDPSQNKSYGTTDLPVKGGLLLWLDASDDSTFSYSSGTEVSQWRDKSGNNFHANQATTANQPSRNSFVNSRRGVNFTSVNGDFMRVSSGIVTPNYITLFAVVRPATQDNSYAIIMEQDHGNGYNGWVIQRNNNISYWQSWVAGNAVTWLNPNQIAYTDNTSQIVTLRKTSSTINLYSNGTSSGAVSISDSTITQSSYGLNLGYWQYGGGRYYNGVICEILVFNRGLSDVELRQVNTYLGQKWGIANTDRSIIDLSGNDDNGLLGNGTTANMPLYNYYNKGALKFDGVDDYVVNTVPSIAASSTIGIWIKCASYNNKIPISIAGAIYGSGPNIFFYNSTINWNIGDGGANPFTNSYYPDSNWHYIVVTNDATTNAKLYIDGVLIGTATYRNTTSTNSNNFWIGRFSGDNNYTINANIAATQLYNKVLSASEVAQNYEAQKSKFANTIIEQGLVLNIDIDNPYSYAGAGATVYDVSPTALTWTATNTTYNPSPIKYLSYNGSNSSLVSSTSTAYDSQTITMECWFYPTSTAQYGFLFEKGQVNTQYSMFLNGDGTFFFRTISISTQDLTFTSSSYFNANAWNHVVCTYGSGTKTIYVNGTQRAQQTGLTGTLPTGQTNQYIGKYGAAGDNYPFNGRIAESRVYNIALTAAQVLQNYNATRTKYGL